MALAPAGTWGQSGLQRLSTGEYYNFLETLEDTVNQLKKMSHNANADLEIQAHELELIKGEDGAFTSVLKFLFGNSLADRRFLETQIQHLRTNKASMNEIYDNLFKFKKGIKQIQRKVNYLKHQFPRFNIDSSVLVQMDAQIDKAVDAIDDFSDLQCLPGVIKCCYDGIKFVDKKIPEVQRSVEDRLEDVHRNKQLQ